MAIEEKNKFGQYFTPESVADFMIDLADISAESHILEPSCGQGIFLKLLHQKGFQNLTAFEIDNSLSADFSYVQHESFVSADINRQFDLIIGNPPYIRWKNLDDKLKDELSEHILWQKYFNSLCDYFYIFILKSIELLKRNGQLIFICPEYWINTTHSLSLRNYMVSNGHFEEIYHFNETPIFDKVSVSSIIFKFVKGSTKNNKIKIVKFDAKQKLTAETLLKIKQRESSNAAYFSTEHFKLNERWLLQTNETCEKLYHFEICCKKNTLSSCNNDKHEYNTIGDFCDIGNGLVSGLDKAFQIKCETLTDQESLKTLNVVKAKDLRPFVAENITKYIFINEPLHESDLIRNYPNFYSHLIPYKELLLQRYQYNRTTNYWEWTFLRNYNLFTKKERRIFVPCKERISNKNYFRFAMVDENIFPTQDVTAIFKKNSTKESIEYILSYLNLPIVFEWLSINGVIKGSIVEFSEKPIASIPFRAINWNDKHDIELHDTITNLTAIYIQSGESSLLDQIYKAFNSLFIKHNSQWT